MGLTHLLFPWFRDSDLSNWRYDKIVSMKAYSALVQVHRQASVARSCRRVRVWNAVVRFAPDAAPLAIAQST